MAMTDAAWRKLNLSDRKKYLRLHPTSKYHSKIDAKSPTLDTPDKKKAEMAKIGEESREIQAQIRELTRSRANIMRSGEPNTPANIKALAEIREKLTALSVRGATLSRRHQSIAKSL